MPGRRNRDGRAPGEGGERAAFAALVAELEAGLGAGARASAGTGAATPDEAELRESIVRLGREAVRLFESTRARGDRPDE